MPSNCLIFRIDEFDFNTNEKDAVIFIIYDHVDETFVIRGNRRGVVAMYEPYNFYCDKIKNVLDFLSLALSKESVFSYSLHEDNNLPYFSDDISYQQLFNITNLLDHEICGYDKQKFDIDVLKKYLKMLRNFYNI
jgi:hypothetical protein